MITIIVTYQYFISDHNKHSYIGTKIFPVQTYDIHKNFLFSMFDKFWQIF